MKSVSQEIGVSVATLERLGADAVRLQAMITTAAMDATRRSAWCREYGVYPAELWKENATAGAQ